MHGMLTTVGETTPGDGVLLEVFAGCARMTKQAVQQQCAHGLGHLLWNAHNDLRDSVTWCTRSASALRVSCATAVFMAAYYPERPGLVVGQDINKVANELAGMCAAAGGSRSDGCWYGLAMALMKDQLSALWGLPTYASMRDATPHMAELESELAALGKAAYARCFILEQQFQSKCAELSWGTLLRGFGDERWVLDLSNTRSALCSAWPEPNRSACVAAYREPASQKG